MFELFGKANPIDTIDLPGLPGKLGLTACPGVRIAARASKRRAHRQADRDLDALYQWGANGVVTLTEEHELRALHLEHLPELIEMAGLWWTYLPIRDMQVPGDRFEIQWQSEGPRIRRCLENGERVLVHCLAGLGRTGMVAARILIDLGCDPTTAIDQVRETGRMRIQTKSQFQYVMDCRPAAPVSVAQ